MPNYQVNCEYRTNSRKRRSLRHQIMIIGKSISLIIFGNGDGSGDFLEFAPNKCSCCC